MRFRKKPVVIRAVQFNGRNYDEIYEELKDDFNCDNFPITCMSPCGGIGILSIKTLEGDIKAQKDDWIIKGVQGELYPCKPDIFEATYEAI